MKRSVILSIWLVLFLVAFSIPAAYADFGLMLGSFRSRDNAQKYRENFLKEQDGAKENAFLEDVQMPGKGTWYRVCLGPFVSRDNAVRKQKFFQSRGYDSVIVSVKTSGIARPSRNSRGSNSGTPLPSFGTDTVRPVNPPLVPANASITKDVDRKSKGRHKVAAPPSKLTGEVTSSVSWPRTGASVQGEHRFSSESQKETVVVFAGDIVSIEIPGQKQMSHNYDVDPAGRIFVMSVGEVNIGGLDLSLAEKKITMVLRQLIPKGEKPIVRLVDSVRYVNISGGVNYPGWYRVPQVSNLDDLVEMAGGLVAGADFSGIKIRRSTKTGFREIKARGRVSLEPNDVLMAPTPKKYERKIDSGDLLFINIPEKPSRTELSEIERKVTQNQIEVDKSGYIYIPEYGHVYVKNLLPTEVAKLIANRLPKYLARSAKVHVNIIEKRHYAQIGGHVARPGWYNVPESDNIQGALSAAGGAVDGAIMSKVTVTRRWGGQIRKIRVNLYQYTVTGDVRLLTPVHENDSIFVPISAAFGDIKRTLSSWAPPPSKLEEDTGSKVRIFGAVRSPGVYETKEDMNILDLLVLAGGNQGGSDLAKTLLIRENKTQTYDLNSLVLQSTQGTAKIPEVQNGDSVYIGFKKMSGYEITEPKKMVRIFGGVKAPGIYEPVPDMTLMDIFSLAKGGTYDADLTNVMIMRRDGDMERFDMQEYLDDKDPDPSNLPKIIASDTIYVAYLQHLDLEKKEPIYLLGKVKSPGQYDLAEGNMTVFQMLAYAGGIDEWADTENIMIIRTVGGRQRNIPYNLKKALSGKYPELNIRLRSFDTIYVP
jgi:protein involved in polysaccharide export with SLBB domain